MGLRYSGPNTGFIGHPVLGAGVSDGQACLAEIIITFALCHVFLHVATTSTQANNSYYGVAVGFTVLAGTLSVGSVSGGCFNPAVAMLSLVHKGQAWADTKFTNFASIETGADKVWIHVVGPLVGAILAAVLFRATHPRELEPSFKVCGPALAAKAREAAAPVLLEFVGTFFVAFTYACAAAAFNPARPLAPLAVGCMVVAQTYAGGVTSGAHLNPAVTLALLVRRNLVEIYKSGETLKRRYVWEMALMFAFAQCVAALCAGGVARGVAVDDWPTHGATIGYPVPLTTSVYGRVIHEGRAVLGEALATCALCLVALNAVSSEKSARNGYFGLAIGLATAGMTFALQNLTGGALSPALGLLGLCAKVTDDDYGAQHRIWIYFVACPLGGLLAGVLFYAISFDEMNPQYKIMQKTTALATLDPTEQHYHMYFEVESPTAAADPAAAPQVRVQSPTQGDFMLETPRRASVTLPPPEGAPPAKEVE